MASAEAVKNVFAMVFLKDPTRKPSGEEGKLLFRIWNEGYKNIPDKILMDAAGRFMVEVKSLFPRDDPFAIIRDMANPVFPETLGDALELCLESVSKFGRYREDDALKWVEGKSKLIAATLRRFGFMSLCDCEELGVAKGQIRAIFEEEKARAIRSGEVVKTAKMLDDSPKNKQLENLVDRLANAKMLPKK